jgi:hypothetical protein
MKHPFWHNGIGSCLHACGCDLYFRELGAMVEGLERKECWGGIGGVRAVRTRSQQEIWSAIMTLVTAF